MAFWGGRDVYAINNTVYVADQGLCMVPNGEQHVVARNNIFDGITTNHLRIEESPGQSASINGNLYSPDFDAVINGVTSHLNPPVTSSDLVRSSVDYVDLVNGDYRLAMGADGIDFSPTSVSAIYDAFETWYGISISRDLADQERYVDTLDVGAYEYQPPPLARRPQQ